jgi:hypothetical protein
MSNEKLPFQGESLDSGTFVYLYDSSIRAQIGSSALFYFLSGNHFSLTISSHSHALRASKITASATDTLILFYGVVLHIFFSLLL